MAPLASSSGSTSHIKNKAKREEIHNKRKAEKAQEKLKRRVERAEREAKDPEAKKARLAANVPQTIENTREYNPSIISAPNTHDGPGPSASDPSTSSSTSIPAPPLPPITIARPPLSSPHEAPRLLITTGLPSSSLSPHLESLNARSHPAKRTRDFIDELLAVFPGAEYRDRAKAKGRGIGVISGWARDRGYAAMVVVGEDKKVPVSLTIINLPEGPTSHFRLTSVALGTEIAGHATSTSHTPELILNNFTTTLGHTVGGVFQSLFPPMPEFVGRQAVTLHVQRDFIFFRRHRYMFKSPTKTALQEIGPRFTLKLCSLKKGLPKGAGPGSAPASTSAGADNGELGPSGTQDGERADLDVENLDREDQGHAAEGGYGTGELDDEDDGDEERAAEAEAEAEAAATVAAQGTPSKVTADGSERGKAKAKGNKAVEKRKREEEEEQGYEFIWKPKMGVSRRNFYL